MGKEGGSSAHHTYETALNWDGDRGGVVSSEGRPEIEIAPPPQFKGPDGVWSPEHMIVASVESCILLTFLHQANREGVDLLEYSSKAEGRLRMAKEGMAFDAFTIRPEIVVAAEDQVEAAREAMRKAADRCLITRSLSEAAEVTVEPDVRVGG